MSSPTSQIDCGPISEGLPPVPRPRGSRTGTPVSPDTTLARPRSRSGSLVAVVPPVPPLQVGGPRDGTPVKLVQRDGTPEVLRVRTGSANRSGSRNGSAPRSSSAARAMSASRVNLAKAVFEAQTPNRTTRSGSVRHPSRRRQIREENEDILRKGGIIQKQAQMLARMAGGDDLFGGAEDDDGDDPLEEWDSAIRSLHIDWRNQFQKLFEAGNEDAMEDFRKCVGGTFTATVARSMRPVRDDEWMEAEAAWINKVEKRLRTVTVRCLRERADLNLRQFLLALEAVVMYFVEMRAAPPMSILSSCLTALLAEPLTVEIVTKTVVTRGAKQQKSRKKGPKSSQGRGRRRAYSVGVEEQEGKQEDKDGGGEEGKVDEVEQQGEATEEEELKTVQCLRVSLRESSLHRLCLHTLCQFYSLKCKSYNDEAHNDEAKHSAGKKRSTFISLPDVISAKKTPMLHRKVSLAAFLKLECAGE